MRTSQAGSHRCRQPGFTVTEAIVALAVSLAVLVGVTTTFLTQVKQYRQFRDLTELRQNADAAMQRVLHDIRLAGYGLPVHRSHIAMWVTWVPGMTDTVRVVEGAAGATDKLLLCGVFRPSVAKLLAAATRGDTSLHLGVGQGAQFNTTTRKLIYIGRIEMARVVGIAGDTITVSVHPTVANRGVRYDYPVGTGIELIEVKEYACESTMTNALGRPYLERHHHQGILTNRLQKLVALGIEDFQITTTGRAVSVSMTSISQRPERGYTHPVSGDRYRRTSAVGTAVQRNLED